MKSFALAVLGRRNPVARVFNDRFKAIDRRVGFGFNDLAESLVGVFQPLFVFGLPVLGEGLFGDIGIGFHQVDRLDVRLKNAPRDITLSCKNALGRYQARALERYLEVAQIEQYLRAQAQRLEVVRRRQKRSIDRPPDNAIRRSGVSPT